MRMGEGNIYLQDLEAYDCRFSKEMQRPVGKRQLIAMINMVEMVIEGENLQTKGDNRGDGNL